MSQLSTLHAIRYAACTVVLAVAAVSLPAHGEQKNSGNMNCDGEPVKDRQYEKQPGDVLAPHHIELMRPFAGTGKLDVSVCNAQLHVRTKADAKELRLFVETDAQRGGSSAEDYVHIFRIGPDGGVIHLKFPGDSHATVTLVLPLNAGSDSQFNLGKGNLEFDAIGGAGEREINVGYGHAKLLVDGDKSYSNMEVNIGMGSLDIAQE